MSVCGQNGQTEDDSSSEEVTAAAVREIYKQKPASKVVRVLTVLAYLLSVSLAAILLSVYYVCVWKSPDLPPLGGSGAGTLSARRGHHHDYMPLGSTHNATGGGDSGVNALIDQPPATNAKDFNASVAESTPALDESTTSIESEETTNVPLNSTFDIGTDDTGSGSVT